MNKFSLYKNDIPRFELDRSNHGRNKIDCPVCGGKKCFVTFVDITTGEHLPGEYGVCDRANKCGHKNYPKGKDFRDKTFVVSTNEVRKEFLENNDLPNCIEGSKLIKTLNNYSNNKLFQFLSGIYGYEKTVEVFLKYCVGTYDYFSWKGCALFWQIDPEWVVRTGKIMEYSIVRDGNRDIDIKRFKSKDGMPHIQWMHVLESRDYVLQQCLFGSHLLSQNPKGKKICIVEAEKTAVIAHLETPGFIFMSCGSVNNLTEDKMRILKNEEIMLYPDKGCYELWKEKVDIHLGGYNITISDKLEKDQSVKDGEDIADIIIRKHLKQ